MERDFLYRHGVIAKGNGFKLKDSRFILDVRKKFFTVRVMRHWKRLSEEAVDGPSLKCSKPG